MKAWLLVQKSSKIDKICRRNKILTSPGIFRSCSTNSNGITDPKDIEALNGVIETTYSSISELSYVNPKNAVIRAIAGIHDFTDLPYWQTIICFTLSLRVLLLPIAIRSMQNAARMAVMRPELEKVQNEFKAKADYLDEKQQLIFQQQVKALFLKHRVNPIRAVLLPLFQLPIFISVFTALNNINAYLPGYVNGGDFWFVNLAAPDTYYIFPIVNALSFLMMVEMGADGMAMNQKKTFQWAMRGLSVVMIPLTMSVSQGMFVYWTTNNFFSILQTAIIHRKAFKRYFDIPEPPKNAPNLNIRNPVKALVEAVNEGITEGRKAVEKYQSEDKKTFYDGQPTPPPPPPPSSLNNKATTYSSHPHRNKTKE